MNTRFKIIVRSLVLGGLFLLRPASAQTSSTYVTNAMNGPIECRTTSTNLGVAAIATNHIWQGRHLGIGVQYGGGSSTNTGTVGFLFGVLSGGTNNIKTTTKPFVCNSTANGVTGVNDWFVLPSYTLGPADSIVLLSITNAAVNVNPSAAGSIVVTNVWYQNDTRP